MKKEFYFLHIPKTGGIHLVKELRKLVPNLFDSKIEYNLHRAWYFGDKYQNKYILSCFRDPTERIISHYAFEVLINNFFIKKIPNFEKLPKLKNEKIYIDYSISSFYDWLNNNKAALSNFQSKNILYEKASSTEIMSLGDYKNEKFSKLLIDEKILLQRLEYIEIFLKTSQLKTNTIISVATKLKNDFNLKNEHTFIEKVWNDEPKTFINKNGLEVKYFPIEAATNNVDNINKESNKLYSQLTQKDFDYLKKFNNIDYEIYNNQSLFWNGGK